MEGVGDSSLDDRVDVKWSDIAIPPGELSRERIGKARIGCCGLAVCSVGVADFPGEHNTSLGLIDEGDTRLEREREVPFRVRRDAAIAGCDHEPAPAQVEPAGSVHWIRLVGIPVDVVDGEHRTLLCIEGSINPVAVVEQVAGANVERSMKGIDICS